MAVGDTFEIRPHSTISHLFGSMNSAGLLEGLNASDADNILLPEPSGFTSRIFYSNAPADTGWKTQTYADAGDQVINPEGGFIIARKSPGAEALYTQGALRELCLAAPIEEGFNLLSIVSPKEPLTLDELGLYTGNPQTGIAPGPNANETDTLWEIDSTTGLATRYFHDGTNWYDAQYNLANDHELDPTASFYIKRLPGDSDSTGFNWKIPDITPDPL